MKNMRATWDLPTTRVQGGDLDPSDIAFVGLSLSADGGANFSALGGVLPGDPQEFVASDLDVSSYILRAVVELNDGQRSVDVDTLFDVVDDSAPSGVLNVIVNLS